MKRVFAFILALIITTPSIYAQTQLTLSSHDTAMNWLCSEILKEAYLQLGIKISIEKYPSKRSLKMSNSGQVDGEMCRVRGIEKNYPNVVKVPFVLQTADAVVFTKKQGLIISHWNDLKPL